MAANNIIELQNISLVFPGVRALNEVNLAIHKGEIHVLLGENGAGKSSLIKTICGVYQQSSGTMIFDGLEYAPLNPLTAIQKGVRVVYQEFNLLPYLSIAENIFFEKLPSKGGLVDYQRLNHEASLLMAKVGLGKLSPKMPVENLGVAQMQLIEIAKALSGDSRILILDEPTATLMPDEIDTLFALLLKLKSEGVSIIYISHRLNEIFRIGDRVTVLRNGELVGTHPSSELDIPKIVKMMVGRNMDSEYPFDDTVLPSDPLLEVKDLKYKGNPHSKSFTLRKGEILGIAGLVGSGRTETMRALFGADPKMGGQIFLKGEELIITSPRDAVKNGICLLTEDRKQQGLILEMSCVENTTITDLKSVSDYGFLNREQEREATEKQIREMNIKTPGIDQKTLHLSGGNQQKILIGKWLYRDSEVFIFDEPTRGIDVGAKYEIYLLLWKLAAMGRGIIMVSSDLPELTGVCHRILVFSDGKITGELERKDFDPESILALSYKEYLQS
ncbi:sugar ABC transporter ATP-binding protein [Oceanispirochaeta crateris]|uniref:Sugar ABC transporter ATP-binding protein n=1 Tax=Oceanispirochaeta crateris TaxID=2518645 RepID=A0A5C1QN81_9SPIO|nr:sugar ABC transporter ATP-binding protein [Oceanispirochaeta crateris]QEN09555.1 sugar ABC transporter ATP-binding protein [Oceanispirochaeta crateris]